ncbi:HCL593Cp [Eremothecium sinecaudum]|uniref:HCL593Cp n=1 Tax=Eremothecium sinecaudum TaxID=45286 RepID=A0A109UXW8_9SACH|nr:HCL593Cp [Eremothecium sinecaudum]AMD19558.1 HCL593Cp [Eremothecium sinecaudum]
MDIDSLINLEELNYKAGYENGRQEGLLHNLVEGKQFGLQVGFQRYVMLGQIKGICTAIASIVSEASIKKNINTVLEMIEQTPMDNEPQNVEVYEASLVKIRNKFRLILMLVNRNWKKEDNNGISFESVESLYKIVSGQLKAAHVNTEDHSNLILQDNDDW